MSNICKTVTLRTRKIKGGDLSIPAKRGSGGLRACSPEHPLELVRLPKQERSARSQRGNL